MPSDAEHAAKVSANEAVLADLDDPAWQSVLAFYTALHMVERLSAAAGLHFKYHTGRNSRDVWLLGHPDHFQIKADYDRLRAASEIARYETLPMFEAAFPGDAVHTYLIDGCLARIRQYVESRLT